MADIVAHRKNSDVYDALLWPQVAAKVPATIQEPPKGLPSSMTSLRFALTSALVGKFLDPFSARRLLGVVAVVVALDFTIAALAVRGLERGASERAAPARSPGAFRTALARVWADAPALSSARSVCP